MAYSSAITLRQNRLWAWGVLGVMAVLFILMRDTATWASVLLSAGLMAVLLWITWPMLPDWRFDDTGVWRGRTRVVAWLDVQSVDVRPYAKASRQLGSIDVVMLTTDGVMRLRLYCRVEAAQLMQVLEHYLPAECDRTPIINAVARAWPKRRHE